MAQPQGGFDVNRLTVGQKILLGSGIIYLISLFFPWLGADLGDFGDLLGGLDVPDVSVNGWAGGIGTLSGVFVIGLLVWEGLSAAGVKVSMGTASPAMVGAILGGITAVLGLINFIQSLDGLKIGAFIGLVAILGLLYGAYVRFQESKVGTPPPVA
jgi:hypothetical protein